MSRVSPGLEFVAKAYPYLVIGDNSLTESRREELVFQLCQTLNVCMEKAKVWSLRLMQSANVPFQIICLGCWAKIFVVFHSEISISFAPDQAGRGTVQ